MSGTAKYIGVLTKGGADALASQREAHSDHSQYATMMVTGYILLVVVLLAHVGYCVCNMIGSPIHKAAWNFDTHGVLAVGMLLLIAVVNATYATDPQIPAETVRFFDIVFGAGRTGGILQLGVGGIYWVGVAIFCAIVMFSAPGRMIVRERRWQKLPPGGFWTVAGCILLLVLLIGILVIGLC